jgi:proteasome alpha subunit
MFHILYDGTVMDEEGFTVLGGQADSIAEVLKQRYEAGMSRDAAIRFGADVLAGVENETLSADQLEVAFLDRSRARRAFHRVRLPELEAALATSN